MKNKKTNSKDPKTLRPSAPQATPVSMTIEELKKTIPSNTTYPPACVWKEEWRAIPIPVYSNKYEVSTFGNIRSITNGKVKVLQPMIHSTHKYLTIDLHYIGKTLKTTFNMHQLVALTFLPNTLNKPQVNHIDFNGYNNRLDNLEWVTAQQNSHHYHLHRKTKNIMKDVASAMALFSFGKSKKSKSLTVSLW